MLVSRCGAGQAEVHTLELTEAGFSLLAWPEGPVTVFAALLESCFGDTGPSPAEEERLPKRRHAAAEPTPVEAADDDDEARDGKGSKQQNRQETKSIM